VRPWRTDPIDADPGGAAEDHHLHPFVFALCITLAALSPGVSFARDKAKAEAAPAETKPARKGAAKAKAKSADAAPAKPAKAKKPAKPAKSKVAAPAEPDS